MGKTYDILPDWFKKTDSLGHCISTWCKKSSIHEVFCVICNKKIFCSRKGFAAITQHVSTTLHNKNASLKLGDHQLLLKPRELSNVESTTSSSTLVTTSTPSNLPPSSPLGRKSSDAPDLSTNKSCGKPTNMIQLFNVKESSARAEIIWALKSVQCNMAAATCNDIKDVFNALFPGAVPGGFSLGRTKLSYLITEALGPYFRQQLLDRVRHSFYTLLYDETTNHENKKELQLSVRFWSEEEKEVVCHHIKTMFLGHATANDIVAHIRKGISDTGLCTYRLLMLGSDGPNVNKKVWQILNNDLIEERKKGLLDVGTCNLHIVHNAFLKGIAEFGEVSKELIVDIYNFFKNFPSRWEDYENIQCKLGVPQRRFVKHVSSRWLTLEPAAERLLSQWPAVEEYFLKFIPSKTSNLMKTEKYKRIVAPLKFVDIKAELEFIIESARVFTFFTSLFQRSEPLIHILYDELRRVLKKIAGRICKPETINIKQKITAEQLLPIAKIECGENIKIFPNKFTEKQKQNFLQKVQKHYISSFNYLIRKNCLETNNLISNFRCLQPTEITKTRSLKRISDISKALSFLEVDTIAVTDEWKLLQSEVVQTDTENRIDHFWRNILYCKTSLGCLKFPSVGKIVKASLTLSHGSSDVERGFSVSRRVLAEDKASMSEKMLNERLTIRDGLKKFNNEVSKVPITKELLRLAYNAHQSYINFLDEQRRLEEEKLQAVKENAEKIKQEELLTKDLVNRNQSIEKMEDKAKMLAQVKKEVQDTADSLFKEGNERLKKAIQKNDISSIRIAQGILEGAEKLRQKEREQEKEALKINQAVQKRKSSLIDTFMQNAQKRRKT